MTQLKRAGMAAGLALATLGVMAACDEYGNTGPNGDQGEGTAEDVEVIRLTSDLTFSSADITIETGTTVRWVNDAAIFHTVTPDGHSAWTRQELREVDATFEHTFFTAGTYPYFCEPHQSQGMTGVIRVVEPSTPPTTGY